MLEIIIASTSGVLKRQATVDHTTDDHAVYNEWTDLSLWSTRLPVGGVDAISESIDLTLVAGD